MLPLSVVGLFCEDIREETSGQHTLVGILPDNIRVPSIPGALPKLAVYLRVHLARDTSVRAIKSRLELADGTTYELAPLEEQIDRAKREAANHDLPYLGLISKALFAPMPVTKAGQAKIIVDIDGEDHVCGVMNLTLIPEG